MSEYDLDLFYHALNYRSAQITKHGGGAHEAWLELEACVNRLIAREREECAKICAELVIQTIGHSAATAMQCEEEIRARGNA